MRQTSVYCRSHVRFVSLRAAHVRDRQVLGSTRLTLKPVEYMDNGPLGEYVLEQFFFLALNGYAAPKNDSDQYG